LVGPGAFAITFCHVGFQEFQSIFGPFFDASRELHAQMQALTTPSIVQVPGPIVPTNHDNSSGDDHNQHRRIALYGRQDALTLFILKKSATDDSTISNSTREMNGQENPR
jgi:hypothetical protein